MAANPTVKRKYVVQLEQSCKILLSDQEKQYLSYALKDYRSYKSIEKFARSILTCLNTPAKLKIINDIRNFVLPSHVQAFDSLIRNALQKEASIRNGKNQTNGSLRPAKSQGKYRVVTLTNDGLGLGFKVCGGKESGTGVYVSNILRDSPAWSGGLLPYDQLVEVNGISLQSISLQSAAGLLVSLTKLKLVVREDTANGDSLADLPEIDPWLSQKVNQGIPVNGSANVDQLLESSQGELVGYSSLQSSMSETGGNLKSTSITKSDSQQGSIGSNDAEKRVINVFIDKKKTSFIGFNIRGGCEYGLGIYVSSVDKGSVAESCGIRVGDQILEANGRPFKNVLHREAVEFFKAQENFVLTVKAMGRIPAEKCFIEEYSWLAPDGSSLAGKSEYLSSSMPSPMLRDNSEEIIDLNVEMPVNETINLPIEALQISSTTDAGTDPVSLEIEDLQKSKEASRTENFKPIVVTIDNEASDEEESPLRRPPSATSLISKKSSDSGKSERGNKSSVNSGDYSDSDRSRGDSNGNLSAKKGKRSKSFLQKQGDKLKAKFSMRSKKKAAKRNIFDSELYQKSGQTIDWLHYIEEKAKTLLNVVDYTALMKQIKDYLEKGEIELFTSNVLELLDTPAKSLVLDIRAIVFPHDLGRFDARVSKREMDNLASHGEDVAKSPILDGQLSEVPPKRTLVTAVQDKGGKFRLKSQTEADEYEKAKEEHSKRFSKKYAKQRSILERDSTIERYKSFSKVPRPSKEHTESWSFEVDHDGIDGTKAGLDYIPTRERPIDLDELYAKVDKSGARGSLDAVFPKETDNKVDGNMTDSTRVLERTMSDIIEDRDIAMPDGNRVDVNSDEEIAHDVDSDDYTELDEIINEKKNTQSIKVYVDKQGKSLGISISGGRGSTQQPEIRIERIFPGGAVADVGLLKAGYRLISVDGVSLENATHNEAVDLIRKSFTDKTLSIMTIIASKS